MKEETSLLDKFFKVGFFKKYFNVILYIAIIISVNAVGIKLFKHFRFDLTRNKSYSLSEVSQEVVRGLADPLRIRVFFSKNLPPQHAGTERYLRDLLPEYAIHANNYFNYTFYDCTEGKETTSEKIKKNIEMAGDFGINPVRVQIIEKDEAKVTKAYMALVIQHGDLVEKINPVESVEGLEYRMTSIIQRMVNKISTLQSLPEKVEIQLFLSSDLQIVGPLVDIKGLGSVPEKMKKLVDEINGENYGQIKYVHYHDTDEPTVKQKIEQFRPTGISWRDFRSPKGEVIKGGVGYAALVVVYKDKYRVMELLERGGMRLTSQGFQSSIIVKDIEALNDEVNGLVDSLLEIDEKIGYLVGKGNVSTSNAAPSPFGRQVNSGSEGANFKTLLSTSYSLEEMTLEKLENQEAIDTLIIAGSRQKFSDYDLFIIDQFLMKGNSIMVLHDGINEINLNNLPQFGGGGFNNNRPQYLPNQTRLEDLISHYGVEIEKMYVFDEICYQAPPQRDQFGNLTQEQTVHFAPKILRDQMNEDFLALNNIQQLLMLKISPLQVDEDKFEKNKIEFTPLFHSSPSAWKEKQIMGYFSAPPNDPEKKSSQLLACLLEGEFPSYFAEKGIPEKEEENDEEKKTSGNKITKAGKEANLKARDEFIKKGRPGKLLVIGSSHIIKENLIDPRGRTPNSTMILNLVDHMAGRGTWALLRSKIQKFNPIEPYNEKASWVTKIFTHRQYLKFFNIFGLSILVGLVGVRAYLRKKARKKKIAAAFQPV